MSFSIPEKCQSCPRVQGHLEHIRTHAEEQDEIIRSVTSDELVDFATRVSSELQEAPMALQEILGPPPSSEQIATHVRELGSKAMEQASTHIERSEEEISVTTSWCKGPLKLRAQRDAIEYTVTVCASVALLEEDEVGPESANVRRVEL